MRIHVITERIADAASRVESKLRGGRVKVVAIQCRHCGCWVHPCDWYPQSAACEACTVGARHGRCVKHRPVAVGR